MKKLPVGIQTFPKLINENCHYVDKTPLITKLIADGQYYFLSRPRRFGKSLLLSTLKSAFAGEKELFKGLYLEKNWDWSQAYPVIELGFAGGIRDKDSLKETFHLMLETVAERYQMQVDKDLLPQNQLAKLIRDLYQKTGQRVVVLIDEYDKPILDNIDKPEIALLMREALKDIYSVLKYSDAYLKFGFLTGVSKFSKVSLFSGLNNLKDISLNPDYATLCGYTEAEIRETFAERLQGVDFQQLADWYNGYNFLGEKVYNPFGILLFLGNKEFKNYWFETGSPTFLLTLIKQRQYYLPDMENIFITEADLGSFDIDKIKLESLLFQTGYLTITRVEKFASNVIYHLGFPNREVKASLNLYLLEEFTQADASSHSLGQLRLYNALKQADFPALENTINALFASIPHDWYRKNQMSDYEGYYASIVYSSFCALGLNVVAEDSTSHGRIDLTVMLDEKVFIIEFKALNQDEPQGTALAQIRAKNYQQKYVSPEKRLFLVGMEFDRQQRNLVFFEVEKL